MTLYYFKRHKPIDKIRQDEVCKTVIIQLFKRNEQKRRSRQESYANDIYSTTKQLDRDKINRDPSPFPVLELPPELQLLILEQLSIGTFFAVRCVCKYLKNIPMIYYDQLASFPDIGAWEFVDPPNDWRFSSPQCKLTVMATPTVFHFGMIMKHWYQPPRKTGMMENIVDELIARIERFIAEDQKFFYDTTKLKNFLLNNCRSHKLYILEQREYGGLYSLYLELDATIGIGVEFSSPYDPAPPNYDDY